MKNARLPARKMHVFRVTFQPALDDPSWEEDGPLPTPQSHPDAFYRSYEAVFPAPEKAPGRRQPPNWLSRRALRKRLYRAGLRGEPLNHVTAAILAGPASPDDRVGLTIMGWNLKALNRQFGRHVSRAVTRFMRKVHILIDEAWYLLQSQEASSALKEMFSSGRKFNTVSAFASQMAPEAGASAKVPASFQADGPW